MSKSDASDQSRINLNDTADAIAQKIRRAKTDPLPLPATPTELAERPEARNLVGIYAALAGTEPAAVLDEFAGSGFGAFKEKLAGLAIASIAPIAAETTRRLADPVQLDATLRVGAERARAIAEPIVSEVERIVGFIK
jgi:tryptophanyl-tRNA synthetase